MDMVSIEFYQEYTDDVEFVFSFFNPIWALNCQLTGPKEGVIKTRGGYIWGIQGQW